MNVGIKTMAGEKCKGQWQNAVFAYLYILVGCQLKKTTTTTITVHVMRIMKDILPDWFGKCAKLAKLVGVAVWVGGAAKMSPRSESKSNFFSWAALWAWERASPGDWVVQSGKKKSHTQKKQDFSSAENWMRKEKSGRWVERSSVCIRLTWRRGVLLSCRVLRGWTSGVLPVLLAEEPDTEAWTFATTLAWSGGTYLKIQGRAPARNKSHV